MRACRTAFVRMTLYRAVGIIFTLCCNGAVAEQSAAAKIAGTNSEARVSGFMEILIERRNTISGLISIVENSEKKDVEMSGSSSLGVACRALGNLRAVEAVEPLVSVLHMRPPLTEAVESPAFDALVSIGSPATDSLVRQIKKSDNHVVRQNAAKILTCIYDEDIATQILHKAFKDDQEQRSQERLSEALSSLKLAKKRTPRLVQ